MNPTPASSPAAPTLRRWALAAGVGVAAGVAGAALALRHFSLDEPDLQGIWEQKFSTPEGAALAMADLKGRPLLINF